MYLWNNSRQIKLIRESKVLSVSFWSNATHRCPYNGQILLVNPS
jgi:hypothetical protein